MDLETINNNNVHIPYLLSGYDGINQKSYFIENISLNKNKPVELDKQFLNMIKLKKNKQKRIKP